MTKKDVTSRDTTAIDAFIEQLKSVASNPKGKGRLIFALDATMSRQPTWDMACQLQAEMFEEVGLIGGLDIQLVYFRGGYWSGGSGECKASGWISDAHKLADLMTRIKCEGGYTQIGRVLGHAKRENEREKVAALVFVGDSTEENPDELCHAASELGVPCFMFQEIAERIGGYHAPETETVFREIARLTKGAYSRFAPGSAQELAKLLRAVAAYAAGGVTALENRKDAEAVKLLGQMK